jgi:regulator of CtrA degradation
MASVSISREATAPIPFGLHFVASEQFRRLFREGMGLIEETAAYLEGRGREEARGLRRQAALAYATESMRLTTRLMQMASWLLLHRAVADGEITMREARSEKAKIRLTASAPADIASDDALPAKLCDLLGRGHRLFTRIRHLDEVLAACENVDEKQPPVPVPSQAARLHSMLL